MTEQTTVYSIIGKSNARHELPDAIRVVPGLYVFRLPDSLAVNNPCRWQIGHHSGRVLADAMRREAALKGAELAASLHDWTKDVDALQADVDIDDLFIKLSYADCVRPKSEFMTSDVTRNGTYTDDDIREAAAEAKAEGYNALEILTAMSATVPWMGLDTEQFNEAHDRIVALANAA